ncbi:uncharacterized protein [Palaemon carinicauda]|uniref:uncharacterized protein n=1 Tax=Palaemon carinicauda TaxID=392227 RepID=UPI0035B615ED
MNPAILQNENLLTIIHNYLEAIENLGFGQALQQEEEQQQSAPRTVWVWAYLQRRIEQGHYDNLMGELADECPELFKNFTRMNQTLFNEIVELTTPLIQKTTWWRTPIPPGLIVAVTLRFLATGSSYKTLGYAFRVAHNTISLIVPETCQAIISVYGDSELKLPQTAEELERMAQRYEERWNLPHCIGAHDGKHICLCNPALGGSYYYNYKKFYSIVLLAIVDGA